MAAGPPEPRAVTAVRPEGHELYGGQPGERSRERGNRSSPSLGRWGMGSRGRANRNALPLEVSGGQRGATLTPKWSPLTLKGRARFVGTWRFPHNLPTKIPPMAKTMGGILSVIRCMLPRGPAAAHPFGAVTLRSGRDVWSFSLRLGLVSGARCAPALALAPVHPCCSRRLRASAKKERTDCAVLSLSCYFRCSPGA